MKSSLINSYSRDNIGVNKFIQLAPLWKDEVMAVLNKVIYYSYKKSKVAMVDHHTLIDMFYDWYQHEIRTRKFCPVSLTILPCRFILSASQLYRTTALV